MAFFDNMKFIITIAALLILTSECQPPTPTEKIVYEYDTVRRVIYTQITDTLFLVDTVFVDSVVVNYRFHDSTLYFDSLITGMNGERILWASALCSKYTEEGTPCQDRLILGQVLFPSSQNTNNITALIIQARSTICDNNYPIITISVNGKTNKITGTTKQGFVEINSQEISTYIFNIHYSFKDIEEIKFEWDGDCYRPDKKEDSNVYIYSVRLNNQEFLHPKVKRERGVYYKNNYMFFQSNGAMTIYPNSD